jgi:hypothetical protein
MLNASSYIWIELKVPQFYDGRATIAGKGHPQLHLELPYIELPLEKTTDDLLKDKLVKRLERCEQEIHRLAPTTE